MRKACYISTENEKINTKKRLPKPFWEDVSRFPNKFFTAFGAFDTDFAATARDTDSLLAIGASIIAVLPVFDPGEPGEIAPVFQNPFFQISREEAKQIQEHNEIGQEVDQHGNQRANAAEKGENHAGDAEHDNREEQG